MPLALDDDAVEAKGDNGELYLDNGLIVVEEDGERRVVGRWDPPLSADEEDEAIAQKSAALLEEGIKAHQPQRLALKCPLCSAEGVDRYADHGNLCVCATCGCTFDPMLEAPGAAG